jgi:UDP-N-acetylglucosamine 2-epimerase
MVRGLDVALAQSQPNAVLVFGDTDSTLAGALAAQARKIAVVHVEAGVRSGDTSMPEERNRITVDKIAALRLCTSDAAVQALRGEGLTEENVVVGDLMADLVARLAPTARGTAALDAAALHIGRPLSSGGFTYATLHRADVREASRLRAALDVLRVAAEHLGVPMLFAAHPGTSAAIAAHGLDVPDGVELVPPVGYLDSLALTAHAAAVLTDSGGLQREAVWLNTPTLILRDTTEWPELLHPAGPSLLAGVDGGHVAAALATVGVATGAAAVAARASRPLPAGGAAEAIRAALIARRFAR